MDLVSRLKEYITKTSIPVTQFADMCGIARPTLSQLLNGRNKKVSNEIIEKIHSAFPSLSLYWLMFGEGEVEIGENIEFSEGKMALKTPETDNSLFESQDDSDVFDISTPSRETGESGIIEFFDQAKERNDAGNNRSMAQNSFVKKEAVAATDGNAASERHGEAVSMKANQGAGKNISSIMVVYSDNSIQWFYPA